MNNQAFLDGYTKTAALSDRAIGALLGGGTGALVGGPPAVPLGALVGGLSGKRVLGDNNGQPRSRTANLAKLLLMAGGGAGIAAYTPELLNAGADLGGAAKSSIVEALRAMQESAPAKPGTDAVAALKSLARDSGTGTLEALKYFSDNPKLQLGLAGAGLGAMLYQNSRRKQPQDTYQE